jgi:hypothetical protein
VFVSTRRAVVFPQLEHARLAATLAARWGGGAFRRPLPDHARLVSAVANHDRGFALADVDPIGALGTEMGRERWEQIARRGFAARTDDPVVDHLVRMHMHRLVSSTLAAELAAPLQASRRAAGLRPAACEAAYSVLLLCDWIAYDLCLERPGTRTVAVHPDVGAAPIDVTTVLDGSGTVVVAPWPFAPGPIEGVAFAFPAAAYPRESTAVPTPFCVRAG